MGINRPNPDASGTTLEERRDAIPTRQNPYKRRGAALKEPPRRTINKWAIDRSPNELYRTVMVMVLLLTVPTTMVSSTVPAPRSSGTRTAFT